MTYGYIEDLKFAVEVFDEGGNLREVLARLHDLDAARATYDACRTKYPSCCIYPRAGESCGGPIGMTPKCARCDDVRWV
jgi:hypothetical protein